MRVLWLLLLVLYTVHPEERLVIQQKEITVSGNTSIGKFNCTYTELGLGDTLTFLNRQSKDIFYFNIAVTDFACGNPILNNDFRKTIKAKEYPHARVKVSRLRKSADGYRCDLNLEIAGKPLFFKDFSLSDDGRHLMGTLTIDFATLELEAPRKFGGLIKVDDMLSLSLALQYVK
ncbi:MAG TPA: hypothetical protein VK014_03910 [Cyclobacteriaceae bacterium]|nr:hypothetical protein [Cyclobacteriaceae bacterium]